jgi:hypothetical protein
MESETFTKILHIMSRDVHLSIVEVIPIHAMKAYAGHGGRVPRTLNLDTMEVSQLHTLAVKTTATNE